MNIKRDVFLIIKEQSRIFKNNRESKNLHLKSYKEMELKAFNFYFKITSNLKTES